MTRTECIGNVDIVSFVMIESWRSYLTIGNHTHSGWDKPYKVWWFQLFTLLTTYREYPFKVAEIYQQTLSNFVITISRKCPILVKPVVTKLISTIPTPPKNPSNTLATVSKVIWVTPLNERAKAPKRERIPATVFFSCHIKNDWWVVAGGYKATLKNPNVSDEAKQNAKQQLDSM